MDLKNLKLTEMNSQEMKNVDGGWLPAALAIAGALIYVYNNAGDFAQGFKEGYKGGGA